MPCPTHVDDVEMLITHIISLSGESWVDSQAGPNIALESRERRLAQLLVWLGLELE